MDLSPIQQDLIALLINKGVICGTSQVGYELWPEREMQSQGAAAAAGNVIHRLQQKGFISVVIENKHPCYSVTDAGRAALEEARLAAIDARQLSIFEI